MQEVLEGVDASLVVGGILQFLGSIAGNLGLIFVYTLFILLEYKSFDTKLQALAPTKKQYKEFQKTLNKITADIHSYVKIKTLASLATSALSYTLLVIIGLDFALFWAILIFFLNFIPNVGSVIAVIFPILLSLVQFSSWYPIVGVIV